MEFIALKTIVAITLNNKTGHIRSVSYTLGCQPSYLVRYVNDVGTVVDDWFNANDLHVLEQPKN